MSGAQRRSSSVRRCFPPAMPIAARWCAASTRAREDEVADIGRHMRAGSLADLKPGAFGIVLGIEIARALRRAAWAIRSLLITPQGNGDPGGHAAAR